MITGKTKVAIETVASASALVTNATVGACGGLSVYAPRWVSALSRNCALDVSHASIVVGSQHFEKRLSSSSSALRSREKRQQLLFSGVVPISEIHGNFWCFFGCLVNVNLNLRDCEVRKSLQGVLDRVGVLLCSHGSRINLDWAGIVLSTELVNETELEESTRCTALVSARQLLVIPTTIGVTVGLGVIAPRALAE